MKKSILTLATIAIFSLTANSTNVEPKSWNNIRKEQTFKKGDTVKIKSGSKSSVYVLTGKVEHICNSQYIKVNGYFVAIADVEVITKYNNVR